MIDVSSKPKTLRTARAVSGLKISPATLILLREGKIPKGNPLEVAKVAAVQAAKETARIIPYCHPIPVEFVGVEFTISAELIETAVTVKAVARTGVEMEALTAAGVAALTLYDMMKMLDGTMEITGVRLAEKRGGKSDFRDIYDPPLRAAVLVISDSVSAGTKSDRSGRLIEERLRREGLEVSDYAVLPDEPEAVRAALLKYADEAGLDLVMTTGGTGFGPRDRTPEAMAGVIEREAPGIAEAARRYGQDRTPFSMLSRGRAGIRGHTLIVALPGSAKGAAESLEALFPGLLHTFKMLRGGGHGD